jgi:very-short-patch-repair endonuclease
MRKAPSDAERRLWSCLRNRQLGNFKFRRQHPIGPFIVDFCCIEKSLVIELDGEQHLTAEQYDGRRSEFLGQRGYRVIRFWNSAVLTGIEAVLEQVQIDLSRSVGGARSTLTRSARLSRSHGATIAPADLSREKMRERGEADAKYFATIADLRETVRLRATTRSHFIAE